LEKKDLSYPVKRIPSAPPIQNREGQGEENNRGKVQIRRNVEVKGIIKGTEYLIA
jgi:hypothetical protein